MEPASSGSNVMVKKKEEAHAEKKMEEAVEVDDWIDADALLAKARGELTGKSFATRLCSKPSRGGERRRWKARLLSFDPARLLTDYRLEDLIEPDAYGWAPIHYSAFRGFYRCMEIMIKEVPSLLNYRTSDATGSTPLMLAVMSGDLESVKCLLVMGANVTLVNRRGHGIVELCAFKQYTHILDFLIARDLPDLPVWAHLVAFLGSEIDSDALAAAKCLRAMTPKVGKEANANWKPICDNGFGPVVVKALGGEIFDEAKVEALYVALNLISRDEIKRVIVDAKGIPVLVQLLLSENGLIVQLTAQLVRAISKVPDYRGAFVESDALEALVKALVYVQGTKALVAVVAAIGSVVASDRAFQDRFRGIEGSVEALVARFDGCTSRSLLLALTQAVNSLAEGNFESQTHFIGAGVGPYLVNLVKVTDRDLMMATLVAIRALAERNPAAQTALLGDGVVDPVLQILKRSRHISAQEKTMEALWAIAGEDSNERLKIAEKVGVRILVEFSVSPSPKLNYIGADAIAVLNSAPLGLHEAMAEVGGVEAMDTLVRRTEDDRTLRLAVQTMRTLMAKTGFVAYERNQKTAVESHAYKTLIDLMMNTEKEDVVRAEAAYTLGTIAMCNDANLKVILETDEFCFDVILDFLDSEDPEVQVLAGSAIAAFCYNRPHHQRLIAKIAHLSFDRFPPLIESPNEMHSAAASFQVVITARMLVDKRQANAASVGIKTLADIIVRSKSDHVLSSASGFIAALSHTRAGIPNAFISVEVVHSLCRLLLHPFEIARGNAAIALGYLSCNPEARRQLLNECRVYPLLMKILRFYTKDNCLCAEFLEDWQHYVHVGIPPVDQGKLYLIRKRTPQTLDEPRPMTLFGDDDPGYDPEVAFERATAEGADDTVEMTDAPKERRRNRRRGRRTEGLCGAPAEDEDGTGGQPEDGARDGRGDEEEDDEEEDGEEEEEGYYDEYEEEDEFLLATILAAKNKLRCPPCRAREAARASVEGEENSLHVEVNNN